MREGIDVSHYQAVEGGPAGWSKVAAAGIDWCAVKLTEGESIVDPYAMAHASGARTAGMEVGGYHFARPTMGPARAQAAHFRDAARRFGPFDFLALDVEDGRQLGWANLARWIHDFAVEHPFDLLYWNRDYAQHLRVLVKPGPAREWLAWPGATAGTAPGCPVVQYRQAAVPGIVGVVDRNEVRYPHPRRRPAASSATGPRLVDPATAPQLRPGEGGEAVRRLQVLLGRAGFPVTVDGRYGPQTQAAVYAFQRAAGQHPTGIVDRDTWARLAPRTEG